MGIFDKLKCSVFYPWMLIKRNKALFTIRRSNKENSRYRKTQGFQKFSYKLSSFLPEICNWVNFKLLYIMWLNFSLSCDQDTEQHICKDMTEHKLVIKQGLGEWHMQIHRKTLLYQLMSTADIPHPFFFFCSKTLKGQTSHT